MNLIIHHSVAWKQACAKYKIESLAAPDFFPVLVSFNESADGDVITTVSLVSPEMAAKFLATLSYERWCKVPTEIRTKLAGSIPTVNSVPTYTPLTPIISKAVLSDAGQSLITITGKNGLGEEVKWGAVKALEVGQIVLIDDEYLVVTGASVTPEVTDPWNEPHTVEQGTIPGLEELPMDPSQMDDKQKIAEFADPTEHVLDVERSV